VHAFRHAIANMLVPIMPSNIAANYSRTCQRILGLQCICPVTDRFALKITGACSE
jgi:hypothetical protein